MALTQFMEHNMPLTALFTAAGNVLQIALDHLALTQLTLVNGPLVDFGGLLNGLQIGQFQ